MAGYTGDTKCSATQTGYFIAYATWMYLLEPCLFILPGIPTRVIEPWHEVGVAWRRLEVTLPNNIASHSTVQIYYFDADTGLQRRMDYSPDVNGNPLVAHYTSEHRDYMIAPISGRTSTTVRSLLNLASAHFGGVQACKRPHPGRPERKK
jgi:hypothetical protein